ncbi:MAG: IMP dehydrogenase [Candidatus Micrarchaeota archaeon]
MGKIKFEKSYSFDDVLILPRHSKVLPKDADVSTELCAGIKLGIPLLSAPMDTVTEKEMAIAMARVGGLGFIHRNLSVEEQSEHVKAVKQEQGNEASCVDENGKLRVGAAIGVKDFTRAERLVKAGADVLVIDTAHGHSQNVIDTIEELVKGIGVPIIAGNVVTSEGGMALEEAGADAVKVGVGPGAICTTRIVSGVGLPQITAIMEVASAVNVPVIADGGVKFSGDIAKAIAAGAHSVMCGGLLAGTDEAPGSIVNVGGRKMKEYRGMGSLAALEKGSKDRYGGNLISQGVEAAVECKGPVIDVLRQNIGGLRSAMGFTGCATLQEMREDAEFAVISRSGLKESHAHDVVITKRQPNY